MDQQVMQQRPAARPRTTPPGKRMAGPNHARLTQFASVLNGGAVAQRVPNRTGLPDGLKAGVEALSGISMDHVRVHYNSAKPAQLNAHAYAQGSDIHLAPGQQRHLPHEAWHVVQQAQGRVKPTMQMKSGVPVNDDAGLEHEASTMGARAVAGRGGSVPDTVSARIMRKVTQRTEIADHGGVHTRAWYSKQIEDTGTDGLVTAAANSHSNGSGIFLEDTVKWQEAMSVGGQNDVLRLVVPNKEELVINPKNLEKYLPGVSAEQKCDIIAEHELIHLKHSGFNFSKGEQALGAQTKIPEFSAGTIGNTVQAMIDALSQENQFDLKLGHSVPRLANARKFTQKRLEYILNVWTGKGSNAEAPAVMRELKIYLTHIIQDKDPPAWHDLLQEITSLDKKCSDAVGAVKPPSKSFWSRFFG